jgi:hypothetical protein
MNTEEFVVGDAPNPDPAMVTLAPANPVEGVMEDTRGVRAGEKAKARGRV